MPSVGDTLLSEDQIDDVGYFSRIGGLKDFQTCIETFSKASNSSGLDIIVAAVDQESGNSPLHMASANGHVEILYYLLTVIQLAPLDLRVSIINLKNRSGNTSLHWAALNGHLEAVKILVAAGADPSMTNHTGHDAVYEAEINSNEAVVEWLLKEGMGLETGVSGEENSAATNDQAGEGEDYPAEYESSTPTTILADEEDDRGINRRAEGLSIG